MGQAGRRATVGATALAVVHWSLRCEILAPSNPPVLAAPLMLASLAARFEVCHWPVHGYLFLSAM
ncbi:MAG: hypothetical protein AB7R40_23280 [Nitrospiraceae bacterium]